MKKDIIWVCNECGITYGKVPCNMISTWHEDICDICGKKLSVTEPRDFGGLRSNWKTEFNKKST